MTSRIGRSGRLWMAIFTGVLTASFTGKANPKIRDTFFGHYTHIGSSDAIYYISEVSKVPHCGACHYDFAGGGEPWNDYGRAIRA